MPELPEVETIRRQLLPICENETIRDIQFSEFAGALMQNCDPQLFRDALAGQRVRTLSRKGKYLIFECDDVFPVFHLGMSGIFLLQKSESKYPKHIHVELEFASGKLLFFQDMRRFGKVWLYQEYPQLPNLGIDPVSGELSAAAFAELIRRRDMNVKLFLMDQQFIAGIGNIYASEMLHDAQISPHRKTSDLSDNERDKLFGAVGKILGAAIEKFGTTYSAYRTVNGASGENQHFLQVYQRNGQPCYRCGAEIQKISLGNRSTFFCPACQK